MNYLRITLMLHHPERERLELCGPGPVESVVTARRSGNGAEEEDVSAWSPHPFVGVVTTWDDDAAADVRAVASSPLPHSEQAAETACR